MLLLILDSGSWRNDCLESVIISFWKYVHSICAIFVSQKKYLPVAGILFHLFIFWIIFIVNHFLVLNLNNYIRFTQKYWETFHHDKANMFYYEIINSFHSITIFIFYCSDVICLWKELIWYCVFFIYEIEICTYLKDTI